MESNVQWALFLYYVIVTYSFTSENLPVMVITFALLFHYILSLAYLEQKFRNSFLNCQGEQLFSLSYPG